MNLREKAEIIESVILNLDEEDKRLIKKNFSTKFNGLLVKPRMLVLKTKQSLDKKEVGITPETLWFFMKLACANDFKSGSYLYGSAIKKLKNLYASAENKFEVIVDQKSMKKEYSQKLLLSQVRILAKESVHLDLKELFLDMYGWENKNKITQKKWINEYVNNNNDNKENN